MTLITDYTSLQAAVVEYLARDQDAPFVSRVPSFIQLCEAKLNRILFHRNMELRSTTAVDTTTASPEFISLPPDFQSMRRIRLSSVDGKPHLNFMSGTQLDELRTMGGNIADRPRYFSIMGDEIELAPTPDQNYSIEMVYRRNIPPLASNSTNWLLTLAPDIYLYGALLESAPYIKEDARIQTWGTGFKTVLDDLNSISMTSAFSGGPVEMRTSGPTP